MAYEVEIVTEPARGCGYRKPGRSGVGIYLMGTPFGEPCERLPFPLITCPACGAGYRQSRGFTWIEPEVVFGRMGHQDDLPGIPCRLDAEAGRRPLGNGRIGSHAHITCPVCNPSIAVDSDRRAGLLWVGEKFYSTPDLFSQEADRLGISKKIAHVPHGFKVGETYIYLAHRKAVNPNVKEIAAQDRGRDEDLFRDLGAGVFMAFRPTHIDLVIKNPEKVPDAAKRLIDRLGDKGRLVLIEPAEGEQQTI